MASFPSSKVHRPSRRKLGRGQSVQKAPATATPVATTKTVVITFDRPVVVSGTIELNVEGAIPLVTQTVDSPTQVTQVYDSTVAGADWAINAGAPVATFQGGGLAPASGTFPGS
jgi:hypothetical protein